MDRDRNGPQRGARQHHHRLVSRNAAGWATNSVCPGWLKPTLARRLLATGAVTSAVVSPARVSWVAASSAASARWRLFHRLARRIVRIAQIEHGKRLVEHASASAMLPTGRTGTWSPGWRAACSSTRGCPRPRTGQAAPCRAAPTRPRSVRGRCLPDHPARCSGWDGEGARQTRRRSRSEVMPAGPLRGTGGLLAVRAALCLTEAVVSDRSGPGRCRRAPPRQFQLYSITASRRRSRR
jgi:hypothetical protein